MSYTEPPDGFNSWAEWQRTHFAGGKVDRARKFFRNDYTKVQNILRTEARWEMDDGWKAKEGIYVIIADFGTSVEAYAGYAENLYRRCVDHLSGEGGVSFSKVLYKRIKESRSKGITPSIGMAWLAFDTGYGFYPEQWRRIEYNMALALKYILSREFKEDRFWFLSDGNCRNKEMGEFTHLYKRMNDKTIRVCPQSSILESHLSEVGYPLEVMRTLSASSGADGRFPHWKHKNIKNRGISLWRNQAMVRNLQFIGQHTEKPNIYEHRFQPSGMCWCSQCAPRHAPLYTKEQILDDLHQIEIIGGKKFKQNAHRAKNEEENQ